MRLGRTLPEFRAPDEVHYYHHTSADRADPVFPYLDGKVPWPYGEFYLEAMDAHGAWITSATGLVRFATRPSTAREAVRSSAPNREKHCARGLGGRADQVALVVKASGKLLASLLDGQQPRQVQTAALRSLGRFKEPDVARVVIAAWPSLSPSVRPYYPLRFSSRQGVFNVNLHVLTRRKLDYRKSGQVLRQIHWANQDFKRNFRLLKIHRPKSLPVSTETLRRSSARASICCAKQRTAVTPRQFKKFKKRSPTCKQVEAGQSKRLTARYVGNSVSPNHLELAGSRGVSG